LKELPTRDWSPFRSAPQGAHADAPRAITSTFGIGDRLRAAAFAELQAREAFDWAADRFEDAPTSLRTAWKGLALAEDRHLGWLLNRMKELGIDAAERQVSDQLWYSLVTCQNARDFAKYMASAEERGRKAGERFCQAMSAVDPVSAGIFGKIAEEEVAHIELATRYFPEVQAALR
jgi:uncharacterized ferritin-like protein (DUF455 family)